MPFDRPQFISLLLGDWPTRTLARFRRIRKMRVSKPLSHYKLADRSITGSSIRFYGKMYTICCEIRPWLHRPTKNGNSRSRMGTFSHPGRQYFRVSSLSYSLKCRFIHGELLTESPKSIPGSRRETTPIRLGRRTGPVLNAAGNRSVCLIEKQSIFNMNLQERFLSNIWKTS